VKDWAVHLNPVKLTIVPKAKLLRKQQRHGLLHYGWPGCCKLVVVVVVVVVIIIIIIIIIINKIKMLVYI
jgi:hypothetical protein